MIFHKEEKMPFTSDGVNVYCCPVSATLFHPGMLRWLFGMIHEHNKDEIMNEDNKIEVLIRMTAPQQFRATYRFGDGCDVRALEIMTDGQNFQIFEDPSTRL